MVDTQGVVTTGLLSGVRYVKDNRLLPDGPDADFVSGYDRVRYSIPASAAGTMAITVELLYQSIGYRWAHNLSQRPAPERHLRALL